MKARRLLAGLLAAASIGPILALTGPAGAADAAAPQIFKASTGNSINVPKCMDSWGRGEHEAYTTLCPNNNAQNTNNYQKWTVKVVQEPQAHAGTVVQLRNVAAGTCLDSHGAGGGGVYVQECNTSDYQLWEVFKSPFDSSYIRFKSWGSWTLHSKHMCLEHAGEWDAPKRLIVTADCDADGGDNNQYWH